MRKSIDELIRSVTPSSKLRNPAHYLYLNVVDVFAYVASTNPGQYNAMKLCDSLDRWMDKEKLNHSIESIMVIDVFSELIPKHRKFTQYTKDERVLIDALVLAPFAESEVG